MAGVTMAPTAMARPTPSTRAVPLTGGTRPAAAASSRSMRPKGARRVARARPSTIQGTTA